MRVCPGLDECAKSCFGLKLNLRQDFCAALTRILEDLLTIHTIGTS